VSEGEEEASAGMFIQHYSNRSSGNVSKTWKVAEFLFQPVNGNCN